jgi:uncharacterized protein
MMDYEKAKALVDSLPPNIAAHSRAVCRKAVEVAERIRKNGHKVDVEKVRLAALLHDVGRLRSHGPDHGMESGRMLKELGAEPWLVRAVERHCVTVFRDTPLAEYTLEEKIVSYADGCVREDREVSFEERFKDLIKRRRQHGKLDEVALFEQTSGKYRQMCREIEALL